MDRARAIKDLCIANEALSRFPGTERLSNRLDDLLDTLTNQLQEELHPPLKAPSTDTDDEIPF